MSQTMSPEHHASHLAFARAQIVKAAADRKPILSMLEHYTDDVYKAALDISDACVEALEDVLQRVQTVGSRKATSEQISSLRTLVRHSSRLATDYEYGIDSLRIYFSDGSRVCVSEQGELSS